MRSSPSSSDGRPSSREILASSVSAERNDVLSAMAKGGDLDRENGQPMKEVLAKCAFDHHLAQVAIGGGDPANVGENGPVAADALELLLLQHPQQLRLQWRVELGDFVEEEGAAVRQLDAAASSCIGAGERAFFMAEEFTLEQGLGQGSTVDSNERPR